MDPFAPIDAAQSGDRPITWHLDPTVWQRAVWRQREALLWWTGPSTQTAWCVYEAGGLDPIAMGTGAGEQDGKAQAERVLRAGPP